MNAYTCKVDIDSRGIYFVVGRRVDEMVMLPEQADALAAVLDRAVDVLRQIKEVNLSIADYQSDISTFRVVHIKGKVHIRFHHSDRLTFKTTGGFVNFVNGVKAAAQDARLFGMGLVLDYDDHGMIKSTHNIATNTTRIIR